MVKSELLRKGNIVCTRIWEQQGSSRKMRKIVVKQKNNFYLQFTKKKIQNIMKKGEKFIILYEGAFGSSRAWGNWEIVCSANDQTFHYYDHIISLRNLLAP